MRTAIHKTIVGKLIMTLLVVAALLGLVYLLLRLAGFGDISRESLQAFIESTGVIAPIIYILISFLQVTFIPIPGAVTILAGCYVFGTLRAVIYSYIGMMIGSMVAYWLGKFIGRRFVNWLFGSSEKTDEWLAKFKERENVLLFFMFLFPGFPDDLLCSLAGILPITWGGFFVMQLVTRTTSIGATALFLSGEVIPFEGWGLVVLGCAGVLGLIAFVICFKNAARLNAYFTALLQRISRWRIFNFAQKFRTKMDEFDKK